MGRLQTTLIKGRFGKDLQSPPPFFLCLRGFIARTLPNPTMEMKKVACAVFFAAASLSAVMAEEAAPAPAPTSGASPLLGHWLVPPLHHSLPSSCNKFAKKPKKKTKKKKKKKGLQQLRKNKDFSRDAV